MYTPHTKDQHYARTFAETYYICMHIYNVYLYISRPHVCTRFQQHETTSYSHGKRVRSVTHHLRDPFVQSSRAFHISRRQQYHHTRLTSRRCRVQSRRLALLSTAEIRRQRQLSAPVVLPVRRWCQNINRTCARCFRRGVL